MWPSNLVGQSGLNTSRAYLDSMGRRAWSLSGGGEVETAIRGNPMEMRSADRSEKKNYNITRKGQNWVRTLKYGT